MNKKITILLSVLLLQTIWGEPYHQVRVFDTSHNAIHAFNEMDIPTDHVLIKQNVFIDLTVTESQLVQLDQAGFIFEILQRDLSTYFQERSVSSPEREFPLGSLLGNYSWDELNVRMDELQAMYPNLISERHILGSSIEGRDIWAVKVSDNPNEDEIEPEVLYTGLTHAREPVSMMNLFYFIQLLCENYGTDPELTFLVNEREMWFLPVINPDGYVYNEEVEPSGGGMHRKNRREESSNCNNNYEQGVDLNRNYGFNWGANNTGSSPNPCSSVYRGTEAFSEPETQAVRDFISSRSFKDVLHYHTYSNVLIHSFGDASLPPEPDLSTLREIGEEMTRYNGYPVGTGYELIGYTVNGDAVDWTFGDQGIISYTPEVGSYSDYFWPSEDRVIPLCEAQVHPNKIFALVAGSDFIVYDAMVSNEQPAPGDTIDISIVIQNRGLTDSNGPVTLSVEPLNAQSYILNDGSEIMSLPARTTSLWSTQLIASELTLNGSDVGFIITMEDNNSFLRSDTIRQTVGSPMVVFLDSFEAGMNQWSSESWGLSTESATGNYSVTDSPEGNYSASVESVITFTGTPNLANIVRPFITFQAKWAIEDNWDFVRFQGYTVEDGWVSLSGDYTVLGNGQSAQPAGEAGYDGSQVNWITERIDLDQLGGHTPISFRFILTSDNYVEEDGFYFDNFTISGFSSETIGNLVPDLSIDIYDLLLLAKLIMDNHEDPTPYQLSVGDLNGNGSLDISDLTLLISMIMEME